MNKQDVVLLKLMYFKPSPLFDGVDFDDTEFTVKFYHKESSTDFDYTAPGGKTRTHKTGETEHEIVIESITFAEGSKKDELLPLLLEKSVETISDILEERIRTQ